jgi:altronate hydrolase
MDFDAGVVLNGGSVYELDKSFYKFVIDVASGKPTCNEKCGYSEVAIFKTGVTL